MPSEDFGAAEQLVGIGSLSDREAMGDQRLGAQGAGIQGMKHSLEIALLRPAHKANGVVVPLLLIGRVVTTGPVRTTHLEGELFFIEKIAA